MEQFPIELKILFIKYLPYKNVIMYLCLDNIYNFDIEELYAMSYSTPWFVAIEKGYLKLTKFLINDYGINPAKERMSDGLTALHLASGQGHIHIIKYLLSLPNINSINYHHTDIGTPLHQAVNQPETLKVLLEYGGADVNAQDNEGKTALHLAAYVHNKRSIRILLSHGANKAAKCIHGYKPIDYYKLN